MNFNFKINGSEDIYTAKKAERPNYIELYRNNMCVGEIHQSKARKVISNGTWNILETTEKYESLGADIGKLVDEKQKQYGNSFGKADEFLKILYPNGIKPEHYKDLLTLT